ncbi:TetR/AcrR family transcriptional regulator [Mycolicibacterium mengxianglii]|uniref:TetR/AcrR family transcriptional regulator n=1 Tax=Mycolicibacterium mengxianglii TaxID=2736649 RepID=UPI0018D082A2|nr:TetR family transcriptional regulator [Mycolicibacterium mengxianglii]
MPKVDESYLSARRQQIVDAARIRFASQGFAGTSLADIVAESGLSNGAIYRYFSSKDEIVAAICDQAGQTFPTELTAAAIDEFLEHIRARARDEGHARLVAQIYAEAALSPPLAALVQNQLTALRDAVAALLPHREQADSIGIAEVFVAVCVGYSQQLAVRGDVDPAPFARALMAIIGSR